MRKLSQKEKRTVKIGAVGAAIILTSAFATKWLGHWAQARESLAKVRDKLKAIDVHEAKQAGLMSKVPVFQMPQAEQTQKFLFRDKLNEQLNDARIKSQPLQVLAAVKSPVAGYKLLRLKCSAKCRFTQVLELLANLNNNPYLVGIEEIKIKCDPKKPQEVDLDLTVSTLVK